MKKMLRVVSYENGKSEIAEHCPKCLMKFNRKWAKCPRCKTEIERGTQN